MRQPKPTSRLEGVGPRPGVSPLRCPRCGASLGYLESTPRKRLFVRCAGCRFEGPGGHSVTDAVYQWNKLPRA